VLESHYATLPLDRHGRITNRGQDQHGACGEEMATAMSINLSMCKSLSQGCYKMHNSFGQRQASAKSRDIVGSLGTCLPPIKDCVSRWLWFGCYAIARVRGRTCRSSISRPSLCLLGKERPCPLLGLDTIPIAVENSALGSPDLPKEWGR
jgi:hypothetical protein